MINTIPAETITIEQLRDLEIFGFEQKLDTITPSLFNGTTCQ